MLLFSCAGLHKTEDPVARSLEYQPWEDTPQPEGSAAYLGLGSYAKVLCTAIFESGREAKEAANNSGKIILAEEYHDEVAYQVNRERQQVVALLGDSLKRSATYHADQGCIIDRPGGLQFEPVRLKSGLPPADTQPWPMGDLVSPEGGYSRSLLDSALAAAFDSSSLTAAFLVIHKGEIILERYREGVDKDTQLESWSMGKSLTATLIGRLIHDGELSLDQKAPVKEWQTPGDPRSEITIRQLLQMSSGLRFPAHRDPEVKVPLAKLAHMYVYCDAINVFEFSVNRPLEFVPGTTGRYRNCDPLTLGYIVRNTVEAGQRNYWTWPQEALFDKIGIRRQLLETDPYGNFILTGFDYGTARNWGRLGLLYLQDGMWNGERLLPEGYAEFVSTPAASWERPIYGGLFWINGTGEINLPPDTYYMAGGGGQRTLICPSLDLVVVRMGHSEGAAFADTSLNQALGFIRQALE
ncbi:MAG: serine hydrolase [Saprospiraceae bacterium]|nr:serine hydrolase [Saprospiraceae bacterium]